MRTLCAWCGKIMAVPMRELDVLIFNGETRYKNEAEYVKDLSNKTSHGICERCRANNFPTPTPVQNIIIENNIALPLVIRAARADDGRIFMSISQRNQKPGGASVEVPANDIETLQVIER